MTTPTTKVKVKIGQLTGIFAEHSHKEGTTDGTMSPDGKRALVTFDLGKGLYLDETQFSPLS